MSQEKYFCVPADFKEETIDAFDDLNNEFPDSRVIEVYGNITVGNSFESGRSIGFLPKIDFSRLEQYVKYAKTRNIDFNYTLNSPHMQNREFTAKGILELTGYLETLYELGVDSLTVCLPSVLEIVKSIKYKFRVKSSVICQIFNASKAMFYKDWGVERIVADESITRDFRTIKEIIGSFGDKVELIVNPVCNKNCTYRMFHYNQIAGDSIVSENEASANYYEHRCFLFRHKNIGNLMRIAWIRPEDLHHYTDAGLRYFKLQGRDTLHKGDIVRATRHYFEGSYDGNLLDLLDIFGSNSSFAFHMDNKKLDGFIDQFVKNPDFCRNNCVKCGYCEGFGKKVLDPQAAQNVYDMASKFYGDYDHFNRIMKSVMETKTSGDSGKKLDADFDL